MNEHQWGPTQYHFYIKLTPNHLNREFVYFYYSSQPGKRNREGCKRLLHETEVNDNDNASNEVVACTEPSCVGQSRAAHHSRSFLVGQAIDQ